MDIDFQYELTPASVVMDVGGFNGDFSEFIRKKYKCGVHVFEPCTSYFRNILNRFSHDPLVWPYSIALEDVDEDRDISIRSDSSSFYQPSPDRETVRVRDIRKFLQAFHLDHIDLLKLNCEGSEYKILTRLHHMDWIERVKNIVVQFHDVSGWNKESFERIFRLTHKSMHRCDHWQWWKRN